MAWRVVEVNCHENSIGEQGNGPYLEVCVVDSKEEAKAVARARRTVRPAGAGYWTDAWVEKLTSPDAT